MNQNAQNIYALRLTSLQDHFGKWLSGSGPESDIIISSRIRVARNLNDFPFPNRADHHQLNDVLELVKDRYRQVDDLGDSFYIDFQGIEKIDRQFLLERHLISPDLMEGEHPAGLIVGRDETISIMINEEDHLRIQAIQSGMGIRNGWMAISRIDDDLADLMEFAFSDQYGYLTACPTNAGTGLRVSILIHLAGLVMTQELAGVVKEKISSDISIRGFYGEGSEAVGDIFQVSNQLTLGRSEPKIIEQLLDVAEAFLSLEKNARGQLDSITIEDKVERAIGIIRHAKLMSSSEFMNLLSAVRLGSYLNLIPLLDRKLLNELMILVQPAHLQKHFNKIVDSHERDQLRANLIRKWLEI